MSRKSVRRNRLLLGAGLSVSLLWLGLGLPAAEAAFRRGDANLDGELDLSDAVGMLLCHFLGGPCSICADAADSNDDGQRDVSDPIYLLGFLFTAGPPPPAPFATCGADPTDDGLDCISYPGCGREDGIPTSRGELEVVPVEHASLVLRWDGKAIYVDPVGGAGLYTDLPPPDIVLVTHTHNDHLDAATLKALVQESTVLVAPEAVLIALASSGVLVAADERMLSNGETTLVGDIAVEATPMYNTTAGRLQYHPKGLGNGYVLDLAGTRVSIAGDTEDIPELRALPDIALAFVCMNLPYTMTPEQAASLVLEFQPKVVYPYHYRGQDPEDFRSMVEEASADIEVRLRNWYP